MNTEQKNAAGRSGSDAEIIPGLEKDETLRIENEYSYDDSITPDQRFKNVFSNKKILAVLVKHTIDFYKDCSAEQIMELMDAAELDREVSAGRTNTASAEISDIAEYTTKFDVFTKIALPPDKVRYYKKKKIAVRIILDLEMQRKHAPGYPLVKRAGFYAARMLSSQKGAVTDDTIYEDLQPVYTVWVTLVPKSFPLAGRRAGLRMALDEQTREQPAGSSRASRELAELENTADLMRIVFLYIDRSILETKLVKDGHDEAVEYVSLMFAGGLQDIRMKTKYVSFWDPGLEREVLAMNSGLTNLERGRMEGKAEGILEGKAEGILEGKAEGILEGIVILIDSLLECGINISNAVEIASAKYGRPKDEVTGIYSSRIRAH